MYAKTESPLSHKLVKSSMMADLLADQHLSPAEEI